MINNFVVFDVETPNFHNDRICSIGLTTIDNGVIVGTMNYLVNPECFFSQRNIEIHGITAEDVKNSPSFPQIWKEIQPLFFSRIVVAHNASFDLCVLKKTLLHYGIIEQSVDFLDTLTMSRWAYPQLDCYKLNALCDYFDIHLIHHSSESDSLACATILCNMLNEGFPVSDCINEYNLSSQETVSTRKNRQQKHSESSSSLLELKNILEGISEDGIIDNYEVSYLISWMDAHQELKGNYPYDEIYNSLCEICEDGIITSCELKGLLNLLYKLVDPINNNSCACSAVVICGKSICLSGDFSHGSKSEVSAMLVDKGATIQTSVSKKTDIVLVGDCGSDAWLAGNYGTKIKKAMELNSKGAKIEIIKESDLFNAL